MNQTNESQAGRVTRGEWGILLGSPYVIMAFFFVPRVFGWDLHGALTKTWFIVGFALLALYAIGGGVIIARRWVHTWRDFDARGQRGRRERPSDPRGAGTPKE